MRVTINDLTVSWQGQSYTCKDFNELCEFTSINPQQMYIRRRLKHKTADMPEGLIKYRFLGEPIDLRGRLEQALSTAMISPTLGGDWNMFVYLAEILKCPAKDLIEMYNAFVLNIKRDDPLEELVARVVLGGLNVFVARCLEHPDKVREYISMEKTPYKERNEQCKRRLQSKHAARYHHPMRLG